MMLRDKTVNAPNKFKMSYRILLAAFGGFFFTLITTVFIPELFLWLFGWDKASGVMWMMLLSFGLYCALIMWIIATCKLLRTSIVLLLLAVVMSIGFVQLQSVNNEQTIHSEVTP